MIDNKILNKAIKLYEEGYSIRRISKELNVNRKILSLQMKDKHINIKHKKITNDIIDKMRKMHNDGISINKISKLLEISSTSVKNYIYKPRNINEENIIELYKNGYSIVEISKKINISRKKIYNVLLFNNIELTNKYNKYIYNENIFNKIDTEEKAYWLGFLYADGYVSNLGTELCLSLKNEDKYMLENFCNFIGKNIIIKDKCINGFKQNYVSVYNKNICNDIKNLGCYNNKTFKILFPNKNQLNKKYYSNFIRGFFDGDGCVIYNKNKNIITFSICCASLNFLERIQEILVDTLSIKKNTILIDNRSKHPLYSFHNSARIDINNIYNYLYNNDNNLHLIRKYNKFNIYINLNKCRS